VRDLFGRIEIEPVKTRYAANMPHAMSVGRLLITDGGNEV